MFCMINVTPLRLAVMPLTPRPVFQDVKWCYCQSLQAKGQQESIFPLICEGKAPALSARGGALAAMAPCWVMASSGDVRAWAGLSKGRREQSLGGQQLLQFDLPSVVHRLVRTILLGSNNWFFQGLSQDFVNRGHSKKGWPCAVADLSSCCEEKPKK